MYVTRDARIDKYRGIVRNGIVHRISLTNIGFHRSLFSTAECIWLDGSFTDVVVPLALYAALHIVT